MYRRLEDIGQKGKKWQNFGQNGQILAISEFSRHREQIFSKEHHMNCFYIKNYENLYKRLEVIGAKKAQIWQFWTKMAKI